MAEPTLILTGISGATKIVTKLYGPVSPERAAQEKLNVQRRADQLNPAKIEKPRERDYVPVDRNEDEFAEWRPEWRAGQTTTRRG